MPGRRLVWRIYAYVLACTLIAMGVATRYAVHAIHQFHQQQVAANLLVQAELIAGQLPDLADASQVDRLCKQMGKVTSTRVTAILPSGQVIGDSDETPALMDNHLDRPEVAAALAGREGRAERYSDTLRRRLMYVAVPLRRNGETVGVLRTSMPLTAVDKALQAVSIHILWAAILIAGLVALAALHLARRISRPLEPMRQAAERLAQGDLTARALVAERGELGELAACLNQMAAQLDERMRTITRQRNELEAVLASMVEGVLAVDRHERVVHINAAGARLLGVSPEGAIGRSIQEVVRNTDLQRFIASTLESAGATEGEFALQGDETRFIDLHGTALSDAAGANMGALVVLHDITRLKRLETVRRDFVANVSHELKTPITALKGCTDTLLDPGIGSEDKHRFLEMMDRHVNRMMAIVEDLLSLSRIESDTEEHRIALAIGSVADVLRRAAQAFSAAAEKKCIAIAVECPSDLTAPIDPSLLEQAIANLIDNAIKYSPESKRVTVKGAAEPNGVRIDVCDEGCGIEKKHLSRIFERFYRVDQARSRALGGTGLGLSIVRHIALAHNGTIGVTSTPGQGSTFTLLLPAR